LQLEQLMLNIRNSEDLFYQENSPPDNAETKQQQPPEVPGEGIAADHVAAMEAEQERLAANVEAPATAACKELCLEPLSFGEQLRNLRAEAGMTVADVAQKVRSSQAFILNLESGDFHKIRQHDHYCKSFIERICMVYQTDPNELLEKFDQESRAAGRMGGAFEHSQQSTLPGSAVFAEDDLNEEKPVSAAMHLPAILISILVAILAILLISAWTVKNIRERKNVEILKVIEGGLPTLIQVEKIPLKVLPIPDN